MFDRFLIGLLRLYPRRFRERYGEEMSLLILDRLHEEKGVLPKIFLCRDLCLDAVYALPRLYWESLRTKPVSIDSSGGSLTFTVLEGNPPSVLALILSMFLSLVLFYLARTLHPCECMLQHSTSTTELDLMKTEIAHLFSR